jgi:hypothetical protein
MTRRALRLEDRGVKALQPQDRSPNEREAHHSAAPTHRAACATGGLAWTYDELTRTQISPGLVFGVPASSVETLFLRRVGLSAPRYDA